MSETSCELAVWELHAHTSPVSVCARMSAPEVVRQVARNGYQGLVITDHYNPERFGGKVRGKGFQEEIHHLFGGYRDAAKAGREYGLTVVCGSELRIDAGSEDYLLYGMTEEIAMEVGFLGNRSLEQVRELLHPFGVLIVQAHPYRIGQRIADASLLDGVEVFNGNPRHDSHNDKALAFATKHELLMTRGSDIHQSEDVAVARMLLPPVKDGPTLVKALREYAHENVQSGITI